MRNELKNIEKIERYLMNEMDSEEKITFEIEMSANEKLRAQGEQRLEGIKMSEAQRLQGIGLSEGQRMQQSEAQGSIFTQNMNEARQNSQIDRVAQQMGMAAQAQAQAQLEQAPLVEKDTSHPLFGKTIVMTGFRDASIQQALKDVGAKLGSSVSKNTFLVLVKDLEEDTGKAADAKKLGIKLMTPEEFKAQYL